MEKVRGLFSYKKYWPHRFGTAPVLPMSREEMETLGWDSCDVILVTGDAYVDHPSFGMALIGRLLEAHGFRVGIIAQPDWRSAEPFKALGRPNLFFGVTGGNMDSMVNAYTADRKVRSDDAYSPEGVGGRRPDRSVVVYSQRCREAYKGTPIVIGGIEASLRRIAHYDYWSDKVRRSVLVDAKADLLIYGNAERAIVEVAHGLATGKTVDDLTGIRGTGHVRKSLPGDWSVADGAGSDAASRPRGSPERTVVRLPDFEQVRSDPLMYARASRLLHLETNPGNARPLAQRHKDRYLWLNPPPIPLSTKELDALYELPFTRRPHPAYQGRRIPAYEMIRFSVNIMRGCFGGCTFCSITEHEGRIVQSRSESSILREIEAIKTDVPGFTGVVSDLGGPTANMYRLRCRSPEAERVCRRLSCVYPAICKHMETDHSALVRLYRSVRSLKGVKKVAIASGVRYDLAVEDPEYVRELVQHHVGGYLKIAPEHTEEGPLALMMKPGIGTYDRFKAMFEQCSRDAGKEQYLIPYFISAHPGTTDEDMLQLSLWLKSNGFRLDQVQNFLPTPLTLATAMYHTGHNPLRRLTGEGARLPVPRGAKRRRLHKAFLRYHDPENWPLLREALEWMGRKDLIGRGKRHLVPPAPDGAKGPTRHKGGRSAMRKRRRGERLD